MSLWRQRKAIERAVAGQLDPQDDAKLRGHLQGCLECRRYYDALSVQARILAGDPHTTAAAAERELARLMGAIAPQPAAAPAAWWPRLATAAGLAAALAFGIVSWRTAPLEPAEEITWRGTATEPAQGFAVWLVAAPQDGGELRRDVSFPGAPGVVRSSEWVAFSVAQGPAPFFRAVLVNEKAETVLLEQGRSVALDPGQWRVFAVAADAPGFEEAALRAAARKAGINGKALELSGRAASQTTGVISVLP